MDWAVFGDRDFFNIYIPLFFYIVKRCVLFQISAVFSVKLKGGVYAFVFDQENQFCSTIFSAGCEFHCLYIH